jgi:hypothetical protein
MLVVRYESIIGSYLGETAVRLAKLFAQVRAERCVLFFDEFDVVGKERGDVHETGEIKRVVSSLLLQVDQLPSHVVVVTATNHGELLDRAAWRRFQVRLGCCPLPAEGSVPRGSSSSRTEAGLLADAYSHAISPEELGTLSFAELEFFALDVQRRYVLALPDGMYEGDREPAPEAVERAREAEDRHHGGRRWLNAHFSSCLSRPPPHARRRAAGWTAPPLGHGRQQQRLGPRLEELRQGLRVEAAEMQTTAAGLVPEDVLVLETAGTVEDFLKAPRRSTDWSSSPSTTRRTSHRTTTSSSTRRARASSTPRTRLLDVCQPARVPAASQPLEHLATRRRSSSTASRSGVMCSSLLRDIRPWSVRDRLEETGVLEDWRERLEWENAEQLPCEIELWFRSDRQQRQAAAASLCARTGFRSLAVRWCRKP